MAKEARRSPSRSGSMSAFTAAATQMGASATRAACTTRVRTSRRRSAAYAARSSVIFMALCRGSRPVRDAARGLTADGTGSARGGAIRMPPAMNDAAWVCDIGGCGMSGPRPKAIDCWLNPSTGVSDYRPEFLVRVARDYFKREQEIFAHTPLEELLRQMDDAGVERAIITMDAHRPEPVAEIARAFPGKFICSSVIDPTTGMDAVRTVERLVKQYD